MSGPVSLQRQHFSISRASEYFTLDGLQKETGQPSKEFRHVVLKELLDNGLDTSETAGVAPHIAVEFAEDGDGLLLAVTDNGAGIPPDVVGRILDFESRTSDKAAYRAPTRGMPVALGAERGRLRIDSAGVRHDIEIWLTPAGVRHDPRQEPVTTTGTRIELRLPGTPDRFEWEPLRWLADFGLFNPHAHLQIREIGDFADGKSGFERAELALAARGSVLGGLRLEYVFTALIQRFFIVFAGGKKRREGALNAC